MKSLVSLMRKNEIFLPLDFLCPKIMKKKEEKIKKR